jgi:putative ABC transport system permease protein
MTALVQAWRALARRRAFTLVTILTLASSAGVTAAVFSVVNGVIWRPLPYPDPAELVAIYEANPGQRQRASLLAPVRLDEWRRLNRTLGAISGSYTESVTDTSGAEPERLDGRRVAPGFFDVFRMAPLAGRTFVPDEERFGGAAAAVIAEDFWTRRFGRRAAAIGSRLIVGGTGYTIVGVMPRAFSTAAIDVWLPAQFAPMMMGIREARFLSGVGRVRPGVTLEEAAADLARVQRTLGEQYPASDAGWSVDVRDLKDVRVGEYRRPLVLLFVAVGLLFAIAATNVAGLVLVQLHRRRTEFAVRTALGATRGRIVAAIMREMLIIGAAAAVGGAAIAYWLTRLATSAFPAMPRIAEVDVDVRALGFVLLSVVLAAAVFGAIPAIASARGSIAPLLASSGRSLTGGRHRLQNAVVVAQLALGVVLAGCAGLLVRSYGAMAAVDPGFSTRGVLTFHVGAAWDDDRVRIGEMQTRLLAELERLPGARAAGYANFLPATGATLRFQMRVDGLASDERTGAFTAGSRTVTPGYLRALAVPLVKGALCEDVRADFPTRRVRDAMVNRAFVDRFAGGAELIGRRLTFVQQGSAEFRIVGVIGDVLEDGPSSPPAPYAYVCLAAGAWPDPEYVVRADGDPRALASGIRQIVRSVDASRPVFAMRPLDRVLDAALDQPRLNAGAVTAFALAALVLAALGLYGLMTLLVGERRRELGVRVALGASAGEIVRLVAGSAARLVSIGLATGVALTLAAGPLLRALLFGVAPSDPAAIAAAVGALAVAALAALVIPVRRALSVSAVDAMRLD